MDAKVNLAAKLALLRQPFKPGIVGYLNDYSSAGCPARPSGVWAPNSGSFSSGCPPRDLKGAAAASDRRRRAGECVDAGAVVGEADRRAVAPGEEDQVRVDEPAG
jgi:hypothetical protein